jgi:hypothetical protein
MSHSSQVTQLVEVGGGRLKPFGRLTGPERRRALRLSEEKTELIARWVSLVKLLGDAWIPKTTIVMRVGAADLPNVTLKEWRAEVETLEAIVDWKAAIMDGVN